MKLSLLKALILGTVITMVISQGVPDPTSPTGERPPTEEELELMSQELRRTELQEMSDNAEKLKITLTSPRTNATEKVAAAAELKNIYEKTRFEMYKVSFAEGLRLLRKNMNKRASKACSDMGVHREKQSDKYVKRNCKKAVVMAWNLILTDYLKKPQIPFGDVKSKAQDYLAQRLKPLPPQPQTTPKN